ncbi:TPA: YdcF family protein [Candidatus Woesearchaeota archaeon]|nr:YdcF family protein [Candidatus Woesearchaeota archaeon]
MSKTKSVLIVLGCQPNSDGRPSNLMVNRVRKAVQLYRKNSYSKVIFSGGPGRFPVPESEIMRVMTLRFIPDKDIIVEKNSRDTLHNALFCWELIKDLHPKKITIITSEWHMPRTKFIFRKTYAHLESSLIFEPVTDNIDDIEMAFRKVKEFVLLSWLKVFGIR